jgi:sec-independent protein translocase protein TatC
MSPLRPGPLPLPPPLLPLILLPRPRPTGREALIMAMPDDRREPAGSMKPFVEHLEDLRGAVLRSLAALVVGLSVAIPLAPHILALLKVPLRQAGKDPDQFLRVIDVTGGLSIAMDLILWSGVLFSAPFILFFVAQFIFPGLTRRERSVILQAFGLAVVLFAVGVAVGYWLILRVTLVWMFQICTWLGVTVDFWTVGDYVTFVLRLLLVFGLSFEFPVVILALGRLGLVSARFLADKRRHVIILVLLVAAVITPTVDPLTQILLAAPMYLLYELCILVIWFWNR